MYATIVYLCQLQTLACLAGRDALFVYLPGCGARIMNYLKKAERKTDNRGGEAEEGTRVEAFGAGHSKCCFISGGCCVFFRCRVVVLTGWLAGAGEQLLRR